MSWCNVLRRACSDYCVNDNFGDTLADFRLKIFTQEKLVHIVVHVRKIFNRNVAFQMPLSKCLVIVAKEL